MHASCTLKYAAIVIHFNAITLPLQANALYGYTYYNLFVYIGEYLSNFCH